MAEAASLDRLRNAAALACASGDADLAWVGAAIGRVLLDHAAGEPTTLDQVLGLTWGSRLGYRDRRIGQVHAEHFADLALSGAADEILRLARRLGGPKAPRPDQIALADPRRPIAEALAAGLGFPKKRQLINILRVQSDACKLHAPNCTKPV